MPKPKISDQELLNFAANQLGGKEALLQAFLADTIKDTVKSSSTLNDLLTTAKDQGWLETLLQYKITDLFGGEAPKKATGKRTKLTKVESEALTAAIEAHCAKLRKPAPAKEILGAVAVQITSDVKLATVNKILRELAGAKKIGATSQPRPQPTLYGKAR